MAYLFREKFNLTDLAPARSRSSRLILIVEPEEYLLSLYSHYLTKHDFQVVPCRHVDALHEYIMEHTPDLLILNAEFFKQLVTFVDLLAELRKKHRSLPVVTIGHNLNGQELSRLMSTGISGHIDRKLTRPKDVVHIVKVILNN